MDRNVPSTLDQTIIALATFVRNRYLPFRIPNSEVLCERKPRYEDSGNDVNTVVPPEVRTDSTSEMQSIASVCFDRIVCALDVRESRH